MVGATVIDGERSFNSKLVLEIPLNLVHDTLNLDVNFREIVAQLHQGVERADFELGQRPFAHLRDITDRVLAVSGGLLLRRVGRRRDELVRHLAEGSDCSRVF